MSNFIQVALISVGIIYIAAFAFSINLLVMSIGKKLYKFLWALILLVLLSFFGLQIMLEICTMKNPIIIQNFSPKIIYIMGSILLVIVATEILISIVFHKWDKNHITGQSIAEALNKLDIGLCCYYPGGQILLINNFMKNNMRLCLDEKNIRNGERLFDALYKSDLKQGCERFYLQDEMAITLSSGKVLLIDLDVKTIKKEEIRILFASDITEEYSKTEKLYTEQESCKNLTKKLLDYNLEIVDMVSSKEKLNAKVKIHDSLGEELLMIKHYIECGGSEKEKQTIKEALNRSMSFLIEENSSKKTDEYKLMIETAKDLGVDVMIKGNLPKEEPFKHIIASGIHVCFTNTIRHAKGDTLWVEVIKGADGFYVTFSNNGNIPTCPIVEKSGLLSLRELVENEGGMMNIRYKPEYKLEIFMPVEEF